MKRKGLFILVSALATGLLSGCSLSDLFKNDDDSREYATDQRVDTALKIANLSTIFLDIGDTYDLHDFIENPEDPAFSISEYTFTSSDSSVLVIDSENYVATAVDNGFAYFTVSGPELLKPYEQTVYVGSIAGVYTPEATLGSSGLSLTLNEDKSFALSIEEGKYHKDDIVSYSGSGTYDKDLIMLLKLNFEGEVSSELKALNQLLDNVAIYDIDGNNITASFYGIMTYEEDVGLKISMYFHDNFVTLVDSSL